MHLSELQLPSPSQRLESSFLKSHKIELFLKRDDLIHPEISGNKWRKLKFNLEEAINNNFQTILTFGGAYSNHIVACAVAAKYAGIQSIGVIRGDEFKELNTSLEFAREQGMQLEFVSRDDYKLKSDPQFIESLKSRFGDFFQIEEGGANQFGMQGCTEILEEVDHLFDYIVVSAGTGTTAAGILKSIKHERLLVFPALKGADDLQLEILRWQETNQKSKQLNVVPDYHFGGFARINERLIDFVNQFYATYKVPLDLIYTSKMMFGVFDLIENGFFPPESKLLCIHTGGLQGNAGILKRYGKELLFG